MHGVKASDASLIPSNSSPAVVSLSASFGPKAFKAAIVLVLSTAFVWFAMACWQGRLNLEPQGITPLAVCLAGLFDGVSADKVAQNVYVFLSGFAFFAFDLTVLLPSSLRPVFSANPRSRRTYVVVAGVLLILACLLMLINVRQVYNAIYGVVSHSSRGVNPAGFLKSAREAYVYLPIVSIVIAVVGWLVPACVSALRGADLRAVPSKAAVTAARLGLCVIAGVLVTALSATALAMLDPFFHDAVRAVERYCRAFGSSGSNCLNCIVLAPIVEETMFRGLIQHNLRRHLPFGVALIIAAALFGAWHGNLGQFVYTFLFALSVGSVYEATGRIAYTIPIHMTMNLSAVLAFSTSSNSYFGTRTVLPALRGWLMGLPPAGAVLVLVVLTALLVGIVWLFFTLSGRTKRRSTNMAQDVGSAEPQR